MDRGNQSVVLPPPIAALLALEKPRRRFVGRPGLLDGVPRFRVAAVVAVNVLRGRFALELSALFGLDEFVVRLRLGGDELRREFFVALGGPPAVVVRAGHRAVLAHHHRTALVAELHTRR